MNEDKKEGFSYISPAKQLRSALSVLTVEFIIGGIILIAIFIFLNYIDVLPYKKLLIDKFVRNNLSGFFSNSNDKYATISPTPVIDKSRVPFLLCPVFGVWCGQAEQGSSDILGLKYKNLGQGAELISVGSGKLTFSSKLDTQNITLTMEDRGIRVNYELTGFKQSTNSASITEGAELGVFKGKESSLFFSVQSIKTNRYIKVQPYKNKYLTTDEGL